MPIEPGFEDDEPGGPAAELEGWDDWVGMITDQLDGMPPGAVLSELIANADVILGLELTDFWGTVSAFRDALHRSSRSRIKAGTRLISINANDLYRDLAVWNPWLEFQVYPVIVGAGKRLFGATSATSTSGGASISP